MAKNYNEHTVEIVPSMFGRVYSAPPQEVYWDMYENGTSYEDAATSHGNRMMDEGQDPLEELMSMPIEDFDDDALEKTIYQMGIEERNGMDVDMMETPYGQGLAIEELNEMSEIYPALGAIDEDNPDEHMALAEQLLATSGDEIDRAMEAAALMAEFEGAVGDTRGIQEVIAENMAQALLDQTGSYDQITDDALMQSVGTIATDAANQISNRDRPIMDTQVAPGEEDIAMADAEVERILRERGEDEDSQSWLEKLGLVKRAYAATSNGNGNGTDTTAVTTEEDQAMDSMIDNSIQGFIAGGTIHGLVEELKGSGFTQADIAAFFDRNPGSIDDSMKEQILHTMGTRLTVDQLAGKTTTGTQGKTVVSQEKTQEDTGTKVHPREGATQDLLVEGEAKKFDFEEDLRSKFYQRMYAIEGSGRREVQEHLPEMLKDTISLFLIDQIGRPKGIGGVFDVYDLYFKLTNPDELEIMSPNTRLNYGKMFEDEYDRFLDMYLKDPLAYRSGEQLQMRVQDIRRSLSEWETHYDSDGELIIPEDWSVEKTNKMLGIHAFFGKESETGQENRRNLIYMGLTNGGRGYYSQQIHNSARTLMDYLSNIGWTETQIFAHMTRGSDKPTLTAYGEKPDPTEEYTEKDVFDYTKDQQTEEEVRLDPQKKDEPVDEATTYGDDDWRTLIGAD